MKNVLIWFWLFLFRFAFWLRYRIHVKGLEEIDRNALPRKGGLLVLPNHPTVFIDPTMVVLALWKKHQLRPIVIDYMYYQPVIYTFMKIVRALPIPNFSQGSNSLKIKKGEKVIEEVCEGLRKGESFMVYPAGRLKSTGYEQIGGTSAAHRIIQEVPEVNIVLVRTTGLWGSSFSRASTGKTPPIVATVLRGIKKACKNLLFFMPRRDVTIEFVPAPKDFPFQASRKEINAYLERWYNAPFPPLEGEPRSLVSYSQWGDDFLPIEEQKEKDGVEVDLSRVPEDVQRKVKEKIALLAEQPIENIEPKQSLNTDIGLDSIDIAELSAFLNEEFDIESVPVHELTSVRRVIGIAAKQVEIAEQEEVVIKGLEKWKRERKRERVAVGKGKTIIECFLNKSEKMRQSAIVGDGRAGVLTYQQLRMRVLLLANYIRKQPGRYIGVMLPASVAAYATVLAVQLAGKIPLMVNWTVGARHLDQVKELSGVQVVLTAWSFVDRLENVDFSDMEESVVMLEEVARDFSWLDKLRAFWQAYRSTKALLQYFGIAHQDEKQEAVLLFTSGTESAPKGVPLTHQNLLANQCSALEQLPIFTNDVLLGILPPFHAFGFTVTGVLPLLRGIRISYSPDPTNGKEVAKAVALWQTTILCGAPTFLKGILKAAEPKQLDTLRMVVTGAEKAPPELFRMMENIGKEGDLLEGYGITECSPVLTMNQLGIPLPGVGRPLPGVTVCIVDLERHQPLPKGEQGLILVRGENIFAGYLNKGLKSPFLEVEGKEWYNTGDLGYIDPEAGSLILSGRLKRFVKIGGEMISLAAVESALVKEVETKGWVDSLDGPILAVISQERLGEKAQLHVVTKLPLTREAANEALRTHGVSNLVKIAEVHRVEDIPIMGTGKVHYRKLESEFF